MPDREAIFERLIEDYDQKQLTKVVKFDEHRFVSIERDALTMNHYVKGHKTLRGACSYLARTVEEGEPFVPEKVVDLDTGEQYELDLIVFVAPVKSDPVAVLLSRGLMEEMADTLERNDAEANAIKVKAIRKALERRR